jgi:hypothetical protein
VYSLTMRLYKIIFFAIGDLSIANAFESSTVARVLRRPRLVSLHLITDSIVSLENSGSLKEDLSMVLKSIRSEDTFKMVNAVVEDTFRDGGGMQQTFDVVHETLSNFLSSEILTIPSSLVNLAGTQKIENFMPISAGVIATLILMESFITETRRPPVFVNVPEAANKALLDAVELIPSIAEKLSDNFIKSEERLDLLFDALNISLQSLRSETNEMKQSYEEIRQEMLTLQLTHDQLNAEYQVKRNMILQVQGQISEYCKTLKNIEERLVDSGRKAYFLHDEIQYMNKRIQTLKNPKILSVSRLPVFDRQIWFAN